MLVFRRFYYLAVFIILALVIFHSIHSCLQQRTVPKVSWNVILISIDTLRADQLGCYGWPKNTTPHIDAFAQKAALFERAFSQSHYTFPSHAAMFTGLFPTTLRINEPGIGEDGFIPKNTITLGELFKQHNYQTAAFTDGGYVRGELGFSRGHDVYTDIERTGSTKIIDNAINYIQSASTSQPFFMFIHTFDVHAPYRPSNCDTSYQARFADPDYQGIFKGHAGNSTLHQFLAGIKSGDTVITTEDAQFLRAHYASSLHYVDQQIGNLLDTLKQRGLMNNTVIIITSDHGERFVPLLANGFDIPNRFFFEHSGSTPEILHVPLLVYYPGIGPQRFPSPIMAGVNLLPTLLELLDWEWPFPYKLDGASIFSATPQEVIFAFCYEYGFSFILHDSQYLFPWNADEHRRYLDISNGQLDRDILNSHYYRLPLTQKIDNIVPLTLTQTESFSNIVRQIQEVEKAAAQFQPIFKQFSFDRTPDNSLLITFPGEHLWQVPGQETTIHVGALTPNDHRIFNVTWGVWEKSRPSPKNTYAVEIIFRSSATDSHVLNLQQTAGNMEIVYQADGYLCSSSSVIKLSDIISGEKDWHITVSGNQASEFPGLWYVWESLAIGKYPDSVSLVERQQQLDGLRALGYLQ